jgi:hypothetical protein
MMDAPPDYQALTNALGNIHAAVNPVQDLPAASVTVQRALSRLAYEQSNQNPELRIQQFQRIVTRPFNVVETEFRVSVKTKVYLLVLRRLPRQKSKQYDMGYSENIRGAAVGEVETIQS